jgi:hypothetical protein
MSDSYQAVYDAVRSRIHGCDVGAAVRDAIGSGMDASHAIAVMQQDFSIATYEMQRPSVLYRPSVYIDGDKWCAHYGTNLQEGVDGFGASPADAMTAFDKAWNEKLAPAGES